MTIKYYGLSSFQIKRGDTVLLTDPFDPRAVGIPLPPQECDVVLYSKDEELVSDKAKSRFSPAPSRADKGGEVFEIHEPGEYEIGGIFVRKVNDSGVAIISADDVNICYLGLVKDLDKSVKFDQLGTIHYLIIPVGNGDEFMDIKKVDSLIKEIDPGVVIPSCYKMEGMKGEHASLRELKEFVKESGVATVEEEKKLKLQPVAPSDEAQYKIVHLEVSKS